MKFTFFYVKNIKYLSQPQSIFPFTSINKNSIYNCKIHIFLSRFVMWLVWNVTAARMHANSARKIIHNRNRADFIEPMRSCSLYRILRYSSWIFVSCLSIAYNVWLKLSLFVCEIFITRISNVKRAYKGSSGLGSSSYVDSAVKHMRYTPGCIASIAYVSSSLLLSKRPVQRVLETWKVKSNFLFVLSSYEPTISDYSSTMAKKHSIRFIWMSICNYS